MAKRKGLVADPNVRIEDIMAAREGKSEPRKTELVSILCVHRRFVSHGKDLRNQRDRLDSIETAQNPHPESKRNHGRAPIQTQDERVPSIR